MVSALRRLFECTAASVAVEAAVFSPLFLTFTVGITDLGTSMFVGMQVNAAAQAGAAYAVIKSSCTPTPCTPVCASLTSSCLNGIETAMNDATGNSSFCTGSVCTASIAGCADGSPKCITVTVNYPFSPILSDAVYAWAQSLTYSSTVTIRVL